jgi:CBS domain-containing protein
MHVAAVLKRKGSNVVSITPDKTIAEAVTVLTENHIGAVLVLDSPDSVCGIFSERDVIYGLATHGADIMTQRVETLMSRDVHLCSPKDTIAAVMNVMTQQRIRHLPVVEDGKLLGVISIGDVVKQRLIDTELDLETLRDYASIRADQ